MIDLNNDDFAFFCDHFSCIVNPMRDTEKRIFSSLTDRLFIKWYPVTFTEFTEIRNY